MSVSTPNGGHSTIESKFQAALNVIKSLPKNGSYKPSPQMMLKFYSYYKQATEGPCKKPKPWAWDVINKAKWDSWSKLGDMTKEKAMEEYVESLKLVMTEAPPVSDEQIVEAMPATDNVQAFTKVLGNFYEAVDLEPPSQFKKFSHVTTSTPMRNGTLRNSIDHIPDMDTSSAEEHDHSDNEAFTNESSVNEPSNQIFEDHGTDESEDEFCDTAEDIQAAASAMRSYTVIGSVGRADESDSSQSRSTHKSPYQADGFAQDESNTQSSAPTVVIRSFGGEHGARGHYKAGTSNEYNGANQGTSSGHTSQTTSSSSGTLIQSGSGGSGHDPSHSNSKVKNQIAASLAQLRKDMDGVLNRLTLLETLASRQDGHLTSTHARGKHALPRIWPFTELSPKTIFFILSWPFAVVWFLNALHRRRLKR